ncbi:hypothetical protein Q7C36_020915 [Tachysurus vachellii]|uniref:Uncharacterized protein n=1 Tax=Tachysurus vachellii TaxID=175792 RepID=A0AA88LQU1_TACVA|nr:hypothetical protein Q7C36_020915 [Tachysurus vachellii]
MLSRACFRVLSPLPLASRAATFRHLAAALSPFQPAGHVPSSRHRDSVRFLPTGWTRTFRAGHLEEIRHWRDCERLEISLTKRYKKESRV